MIDAARALAPRIRALADSAKLTEQYTRDHFMRSLQLASGNPSPHSNFAHLYINGVYWGLYNPVERPDAEFAASYLGGNPDHYDVMHRGGGSFEVSQGTREAWDQMLTLAQQAATSPSAYMQLQGKNLDGTVNPANLAELTHQWTAVHGIDETPEEDRVVGPYRLRRFADAHGVVQVETYLVDGLAHAVPVDPDGSPACGLVADHFTDDDVCAVALIARFWGLTPVDARARHRDAPRS